MTESIRISNVGIQARFGKLILTCPEKLSHFGIEGLNPSWFCGRQTSRGVAMKGHREEEILRVVKENELGGAGCLC